MVCAFEAHQLSVPSNMASGIKWLLVQVHCPLQLGEINLKSLAHTACVIIKGRLIPRRFKRAAALNMCLAHNTLKPMLQVSINLPENLGTQIDRWIQN
jgi:hypothetical protein